MFNKSTIALITFIIIVGVVILMTAQPITSTIIMVTPTPVIHYAEIDNIYGKNSDHNDITKQLMWIKYKGQIVEWTGIITGISVTVENVKVNIQMDNSTLRNNLVLTLKEEQHELSKTLLPGDTLTFRGKLNSWGNRFPITLSDGEIVRISQP